MLLQKKTVINFRNYKSLDVSDFSNKFLTNCDQILVTNFTHLTYMSSLCINCKNYFYRKDASIYINKKAPIIRMEIVVKKAGDVLCNK